jgi:hypothetical protein
MDAGRSMRAVKGSLSHSLLERFREVGRPSPGLMARLGKSIAKQSEGRAGEKNLPVGGRVRKLRAVGDHLVRPQRRRWKTGGRSMHAVKDSLAAPLGEKV